MIGNIGGQSGGGGSGADFKVIAVKSHSQLLENEKNKTVAVITQNPMTEWAVTDDPNKLAAKEGMVCIVDSAITGQAWPNFNMLKKNAIWARFIKCFQYVSGQWVSLEALQMRDREWTQFSSVFSATIEIEYPAGSTCSVTNGEFTMNAPDTSGRWNAVIPEPGDWIIRCTNDGKEKNVTVSITQNGQYKMVTISFQLDIFTNGQLDPSVGGLMASPALGGHDYPLTYSIGFFDPKPLTIECKGDSSSQGYIYTGKKIDVTPYDTLHFTVYSHYPKFQYARFGVIRALEEGLDGQFVASAKVNGDTTYTVDVSQVNGSYYIGFWGANDFSGRKESRINITDIHMV